MDDVKRAISYLRGDNRASKVQSVYKNPNKGFVTPAKFEVTKALFWNRFKYHSNQILNQNAPGDTYKLNPVNTLLLKYFCQDDSFFDDALLKNQNPSFKKGILLWGNVGVGKSMFFEIIHQLGKEISLKRGNHQYWFKCETAPNIVEQYMSSTKDKTSSFSYQALKKGKLYIDDVGYEDLAFNKTDLIGKLLFERHREGSKTFVSTNLTPSMLIDKYGERVGDRLGEMFNIIKWEGLSLRD